MRHLAILASFTALMAWAAPGWAAPAQCTTKIQGEPVTIFYDDEEPTYSSFRERYFSRRNTCPGAVVITYLMPDLTAEERLVFCANYNPDTRSHSLPAQGPRDAFGRCKVPSNTCKLVNTTKENALDLIGIGEQAEEGTLTGRLSSTISAVTHSSGAMVLSGNAGTLSSLLTSAGTTIGTALGTPTVLAGAAASVVVIGGAVYMCSDAE
ncbi:MAG: hypothetical protein LPK02_14160 [Rhodobacterales bacterium]|nr:hypothetical protein [Rhodobacterales bacterium]MDX5414179.1 hypothetical protein [Rhodobacterales bacterium]